MKKLIALLLSACILTASFPVMVYAGAGKSNQALDAFSDQVADIIRSDDGSASIEEEAGKRVIVKSSKEINIFNAVACASGFKNYYILEFPDAASAEAAVAYYNTLSYVSFAQIDNVVSAAEYTAASATAPPANHLSYNTKTAGFDMLEKYLKDNGITYSEKLVVAVIDTGAEHTHSFFNGRVEQTDCNFSTSGTENSSLDDAGHGTHVSGTIIDNTPDNVIVRPYKVLNNKGKGTSSGVIMGIEQAIADGADIINMSLGSEGYDEALYKTILEAYGKNIPVVVSAGNDGVNLDKTQYSPASFKECITVKAATANYEYVGTSVYSNYGSVCDISAPGDHVYSSFIRGTYKYLNGSSMAAPLVTAAAAYILLENKNTTAAEVEQRIKDYSIPFNVTSSGVPDYRDNQGGLYAEYITRNIESKLDKPVFSRESGDFDTTFELSISSSKASSIYYYYNNQPQYQQLYDGTPLTVKYDTVITAYCYKKGYKKSDVVTKTYNKIFTGDESEFEIDSNGTILEYYSDEETVFVPHEINGVEIKEIGSSAFKNKSLKTVTLPSTVTKIGQEAFLGCSLLERVYADNICELGTGAFSGCSSLPGFDVSKLNEIPGKAFENCNSLSSLDFSDIVKVGAGAFSGCSAIYGCVSSSITELAINAFANSGVEYVNLPHLQKLEAYAFDGCASLERAYLPSVTLVKRSAFNNCANLNDVDFSNVDQVYSFAFNGCSSMERFYFPKLTQIISSEKNHFSDCALLSEFDAPLLKCLGENCFADCPNLTSLVLPNLERIGTSVFAKNSFVEYLETPKLTTAYSLPTADYAVLVVTDAFKSCIIKPNATLVIQCNRGTFAETYANNHKITFIDIDVKGRSIRAEDAGLRFGFSLYNSWLEEMGEYGFVYSLDSDSQLKLDDVNGKSVLRLAADNRIKDMYETRVLRYFNTSFNLVFTNMPKPAYHQTVYVRAYICIKGKYLYSDIISGSYADVAGLVLKDNSVDQKIKESVSKTLYA